MPSDLRWAVGDVVYPIHHPDPLHQMVTPFHGHADHADQGTIVEITDRAVVVRWHLSEHGSCVDGYGVVDETADVDEHDPETGRCHDHPWTIRHVAGGPLSGGER